MTTDDGQTWSELLRDIESDPRTEGREYRLIVKAGGEAAPCGEYTLSLDAIAREAFLLGPCDERTDLTPIRVIHRASLFSPGTVVPEPRRASVEVTLRQSGTVWGGGDVALAGSKVWCSVALQPYLWDSLHGVSVGLHPDRYELRPLDEHIYAAPDGSGWVVHGESKMSVLFHYEITDRVTGAKITEDVATLECADRPVDALVSSYPLPEQPAPRLPWQLDLRLMMPGGMIVSSGGLEEESCGLSIGVGKRVSPHWYVGVSGKISMAVGLSNELFGALVQAAPEARYTFHERTRTHGSYSVSSALWVGMRGGYETVLPSTSPGGFGELAFGWLSGGTTTGAGMFVAAGMGVDAPGTYSDGAVLHPYVSYGFNVRFDL